MAPGSVGGARLSTRAPHCRHRLRRPSHAFTFSGTDTCASTVGVARVERCHSHVVHTMDGTPAGGQVGSGPLVVASAALFCALSLAGSPFRVRACLCCVVGRHCVLGGVWVGTVC